MKKAFVAILSLAALVGCSRDVVVDAPASAIIQFGDSFVENKTRAEITTSEPSDDVKDFTVWGYRGSNDVENLADLQLVFNRQDVYRNFDENTWEYSPLQYWLPGESYFFAAVSPALRDAEGKERTDIIVTENLLEDGLGTIEFTNTDGSVDLLYDQLTVPVADIEDKVKLQFAHLLAKIKFSFSHNFPNSLTTVGIKNIHYVNSPKTGTIDVTEARTNWAWSIPQNADNTVSLDFGGVENGANFVANTYKSSDKECLVIPSTRTHHVEFDVVIYHNGVEAHTYEKITSQFEYTFVQGKTYNLKADITPEKLKMDAIEFTVVVEDWVPDGQDVDFPEEDGDDNTGDNGDENTYKLYLNNEDGWEKVYVYAWDAADEKPLGNWPGTEMTEKETVEGVEYFVYTLSSDLNGKTINVIFNNGSDKQTADIKDVVVNKNYFYTNYVEPVKPSDVKLYLNTGADWYNDNEGNVWFAAYFFGAGDTWVKMTPVDGEQYLFETTVPEGGYTTVIFVQMYGDKTDLGWGSKKNQTVDITLPTDGTNCYTIENPWDGAYDWKAHGSWSTYTPTVEEPVEPENPEPEKLIDLDTDSYYFFKPATEIKGGKWYALVYDAHAATGLLTDKNYGYLQSTTPFERNGGISLPAACAYGFLTTDGGFTIQQFDGKYVYQSGTYDNFNVADTASAGHVWTVDENGITNKATNKFIQYDSAYGTFGCYATAKGSIPTYYELVEVDTTPMIIDLSPSNLSFGQNAESKVVEVAIYGSATLSASASETWVSATTSGNTVTVTVEANTGVAREASVTINYGNDVRTVAVSQAEYKDPAAGVVKGSPYSYTFESTIFKANETKALGNLNWTVSGDGGYWGFDSNNGKGQQFGSSGKPYKELTISTEDYTDGIETIKLTTSGASDVKATLEVYVGGVKLGDTVNLTKTSTEYTFSNNGELLTGKVEFKYTQTSSKAIYIKTITIN